MSVKLQIVAQVFSRSLYSYLVFYCLIDPVDEPREGLPVDGFSQRVSDINGMISCKWTEDLFKQGNVTAVFQRLEHNLIIQ